MSPWRNGSRNRLKICYPYGCVGSSPTGDTIENICGGGSIGQGNGLICRHSRNTMWVQIPPSILNAPITQLDRVALF